MENEADDPVTTLCAVTGADRPTAEHILEAHGFDLNKSVNYFLENAATGIPAHEVVLAPSDIAEPEEEEPVLIDDSPTTHQRPAPTWSGQDEQQRHGAVNDNAEVLCTRPVTSICCILSFVRRALLEQHSY